jgi:hypothetical protein
MGLLMMIYIVRCWENENNCQSFTYNELNMNSQKWDITTIKI